jgi:hypothetical protein
VPKLKGIIWLWIYYIVAGFYIYVYSTIDVIDYLGEGIDEGIWRAASLSIFSHLRHR